MTRSASNPAGNFSGACATGARFFLSLLKLAVGLFGVSSEIGNLPSGERSLGQPFLLNKAGEEIGDFGIQLQFEFRDRHPSGSDLDQSDDGFDKCAELGEMNLPIAPQPVFIKLGHVVEGVVRGVVVIAGEIAIFFKVPDDGDVRELKLVRDSFHGGDFLLAQPIDESFLPVCEHRVSPDNVCDKSLPLISHTLSFSHKKTHAKRRENAERGRPA